ncbi:NAD(P)H-hydrate dehydratase [Alkalicoccobacillus murimartini]|uniref:ADP-dependent (S)-NAD(P)H-hydrate dehydratase n=1 Tax=Alkalicoccobacillus murimartini TaxID=171685 RepID=A0ABT9YNG1_9BACI|nr:NAD(P)H-hydrate dehydratase [Alkalicoccobacillus murimartini]MDQ0208559.1 hydroxyethylthiazole kinase-like uncharacterized protein yjeF [Alkalicoccobacillus murimartini]
MQRLELEDIQQWLPNREFDQGTNKRDYGQVLLIGGSAGMAGSIIMSAEAAVLSGAGLTTVATESSHHSALHSRVPEAMALPLNDLFRISEQIKKSTVVAIGPGLGVDERAANIFRLVLAGVEDHQVLILDADALTLLAREKSKLRMKHVILTPHAGEWQRLTGLVPSEQKDKVNQKWANYFGTTVVLKGDESRVYSHDEIYLNKKGAPAMATGGMGDCLTGCIAGICAQSEDVMKGLLSSVYLHSLIGGEKAALQHMVRPIHIAEALPFYMKKLTTSLR